MPIPSINFAQLSQGFNQRLHEQEQEEMEQERNDRDNITRHLVNIMQDPKTDPAVRANIANEIPKIHATPLGKRYKLGAKVLQRPGAPIPADQIRKEAGPLFQHLLTQGPLGQGAGSAEGGMTPPAISFPVGGEGGAEPGTPAPAAGEGVPSALALTPPSLTQAAAARPAQPPATAPEMSPVLAAGGAGGGALPPVPTGGGGARMAQPGMGAGLTPPPIGAGPQLGEPPTGPFMSDQELLDRDLTRKRAEMDLQLEMQRRQAEVSRETGMSKTGKLNVDPVKMMAMGKIKDPGHPEADENGYRNATDAELPPTLRLKLAREESQREVDESRAAYYDAAADARKSGQATAWARLIETRRRNDVIESREARLKEESETKGLSGEGTGEGSMVLAGSAQREMAELQPRIDQTSHLLEVYAPFKTNKTPFWQLIGRGEYAAGIASDDRLDKEIANLEILRVTAAASLLKGTSRSLTALEIGMVHTPHTAKDSPKMIYEKLVIIKKLLDDKKRATIQYGNKFGIVKGETDSKGEFTPAPIGGGKGKGKSKGSDLTPGPIQGNMSPGEAFAAKYGGE